MSSDVQETLKTLNLFFKENEIDFWVEAGTALGIYRDNEIMPWDHDMDVAIWYDQMPELKNFFDFFEPLGFKVVPQKDFPFLDNIIQLKAQNNEKFMDVDIYLYKEYGEFAYMRWINTPVGFLAKFKQKLLYSLNALNYSNKTKWRIIRGIISETLTSKLFKFYLYIHIKTSYCIFHQFPKKYFKNLTTIKFLGQDIKISGDTEKYLEHRYGSGWSVKDKTFNQAGKWKKSQARVKLRMNHIPMPIYYK
tara:strand:- start:281 stop:1027 length:747 start_codon:yes stop_codon:yes gene_type:complete